MNVISTADCSRKYNIAVFSTTICCRNHIQVAIPNTICWWYLLNRVKNWPQDCVKFTIFMIVKKEIWSRYYSFYNLFWSAAYLQPVCCNFYSHWLHAIKDYRKYSKNAGDKITRSMIALITIKIFAVHADDSGTSIWSCILSGLKTQKIK